MALKNTVSRQFNNCANTHIDDSGLDMWRMHTYDIRSWSCIHMYLRSLLRAISCTRPRPYWICGHCTRFHSKFEFWCAQSLWKISFYPTRPALLRASCSTLFRAKKPVPFRTNPPESKGSVALLLCWTSPTVKLQAFHREPARMLPDPELLPLSSQPLNQEEIPRRL